MFGDFRRFETAGFFCLIVFLISAESVRATDAVPMPRERPGTAPAAESLSNSAAPSSCQLQLAELANFQPLPPITGPGECGATDVVKLEAVRLSGEQEVTLSPPATLRCPMAKAVAEWIAKDVRPAIAATGASLRSVETADSFDCRPRNGIPGAKISEHGHANALDVRSFKLTSGAIIALNDVNAPTSLRDKIRDSACARFSTVLGNGADAYHDTHVHIDMIDRSNHYKICQWNVLDPAETAALAEEKVAKSSARFDANEGRRQMAAAHSLIASSDTSDAPSDEEETATVGPWSIATAYEGEKFVNCSMSRSAANLIITFNRTHDGLFLILASRKWKLKEGATYTIQLVAGSRSVQAQASAKVQSVTIPLTDQSLIERVRTANVLEVRGRGATLRVRLDGSSAALDRLATCFDKNSRSSVETNPFVAPSRRP